MEPRVTTASPPAERATGAAALTPPVAFASLLVASWLLLHLYRGVVLDAVLYAMQGLAHVRPELYGHDLFLRYGSQDGFTLFGSLYAPFIRWLGLEHAAALLWLNSQLALGLAAFSLSRRLMPSHAALLAVGLFFAIQLPYGAEGIFYVVEDYLTSRPIAEALVLWAVAAQLDARPMRAGLLLLLALLIHPLMASAGMAVLLVQRCRSVTPRAAVVGALIVLALIAIAASPLGTGLRMDRDWWGLVLADTPYLMPSHWGLADWARTATPLLTLALALAVVQTDPLRALARAALIAALIGLLLSALGEGLRLTVLIQTQPWRWQWLGATVAVLCLPPLGLRLLQLGFGGRAALALLAAAWLAHDLIYCIPIGLAAIAVARAAARPESLVHRRACWYGALALAVIGIGWDVVLRIYSLQFPYGPAPHSAAETVHRLTRDSVLPGLLLTLCWWLAFGQPAPWRRWLLALTSACVAVVVLPLNCLQWSHCDFTRQAFQAFEPWRNRIAADAEVLWVRDPLDTWLLLERTSYVSAAQVGTALFSRRAAQVIRERLQALRPFLSREGLWRSSDLTGPWQWRAQTLGDLCAAASDLRYVVSSQPLAAAPLEELPGGADKRFAGLRLYACSAAERRGQ